MRHIGPSLALCVLLTVAPAFATEEVEESSEAPEWAEDGRNHVALFLGAATNEEETAGSIGLDYFYRASRLLSVGVLLESTGGESREGLFGALLIFNVWKELKVYGAPCLEYDRRDGSSGFVFRVGAEYGFQIGKGFEVGPSLNYDIGDQENIWVYGVVFAKNF